MELHKGSSRLCPPPPSFFPFLLRLINGKKQPRCLLARVGGKGRGKRRERERGRTKGRNGYKIIKKTEQTIENETETVARRIFQFQLQNVFRNNNVWDKHRGQKRLVTDIPSNILSFSKKRKRRGERRCEREERKKNSSAIFDPDPDYRLGIRRVGTGTNGGGGGEIREEVHVFVTYDFYDPSRSNVSLTFFSLLAFHFLYLSLSSYAKQHKK